jgi:hypothetical protein
VEWLLRDGGGRVCRESWRMQAKLGRGERDLAPDIPPNSVAAISFRRWTGAADRDADASAPRITVMLHAAPFASRTRFPASERITLLSSLAALQNQLAARSVRLVVFNLDQQKELFRQESLDREGFEQAAEAIRDLRLGLVDFAVLQKRRGHVDLLADLVNRELRADPPSHAVLFLGPTAPHTERLPQSALDASANREAAFFYLRYNPYRRRSGEFADIIQSVVRAVKGRTMVIHSPGEFARAIDAIETRLNATNN